MALNTQQIDDAVAAGKITPQTAAVLKLKLIGPQAMTPADRALFAASQPSGGAMASSFNPAAVLTAAKGAQKPSGGSAAAAAGLAAIGQPGGGGMEVAQPSSGLAKGQAPAAKLNAAAVAAMNAKPPPGPPVVAVGNVAGAGGGAGGTVNNENPWSNGEAAQTTGEILDNSFVGGITKPNYAKNYAASAGAPGAVGAALNPPQPSTGPLVVGQPGQPMPKTGQVPYVLTPDEIIGLQNGKYNNTPQAPATMSAEAKAAEEAAKAKQAQIAALQAERSQLVGRLQQVEAQLAQVGAA